MDNYPNPPKAGPRVLGSPAGIAAGAYTAITEVAAPSQAVAGETVIVDVTVQNISASDQYIAVTGNYNGSPLSWQFDYLLVSPGQSVVMRGTFTMPNKSVRVTVWSWWWDGSKWVYDDTAYVDIALGAVTPQFRGFKISEYNKT